MTQSLHRPKRVAIFNDTSPGGHYGCFAVMSVLVEQLRRRNIEPVIFWPCSHDWRQYKEQIKSLDIDGLIVNGEGSIHHTATRERAQFLTELGPFCRDVLKIPSFIVNASFYDLDEQAFQNLSAFDIISTRESKSQSYLREHGLASTLVPDFSFFSVLPTGLPNSRSGVFVTDSVFKNTTKALSKLANDYEFHFEVMKNTPRARSQFGKSLKKISREFKKLLKKLDPRPPFYHELPTNAEFDRFLDRLRSSEAVLTGRFHTTTLAIATRTPVLAIESNTPKISAVLTDIFASTERVRPLKEADLPDYFREVAQGYDYSEDELAAIDAYLPHGRTALAGLFDSLASTLR
ncbi:polysaccharide pyruvyl transferase family protein [Celeribacter sp.]|uniref:polysaccharide pyruvyl transferase family protein n=1 Tax=Celeribacter sp. TaxID=1890673 RepID=UPI003A954141